MTVPAERRSAGSAAARPALADAPVDALAKGPGGTGGTAETDGAPAGRLGAGVWTALVVVYVVWGSTYLAIRIAVETMPSFLSAAARFLTAGLLLAGFVAVRHGRDGLRVDLRQLGSAVLVGLLLLTGGNGLVVLGETSVPSGLAALLVAAVPLWMVLLMAAGGERPKRAELAGVLLGLVGLAVLSAPAIGGSVAPAGVVAIICATLTWAFGSFAGKRIRMPGNVLASSAYQMLAGGLGNLLIGLARGEERGLRPGDVSTRSWLALAFLVVFGSLVAFTAYAWLLRSAPLTLVATYAYVNPVVAVLLGWLVLAEPLTGPTLVGGAVVVAGVCLVVSGSRGSGRPSARRSARRAARDAVR
ncbi:Permease of the drug/metabolite transporter (DMT) superfamily [Streptomyces sp. TLI_053]|uniref:EamA family transporter n=1 Tax=Streptomyces sp. TLI_053 TaxID=1855352 RepID=UPI00087D1F5D|nr:EamA family transporter [Streptomyces sp. TLI_053]SDT28490.1 Permease of the drug/metabolite transporter (DMT) superfamily [Streptomyces sp. TLI_053]